MENSRGIFSVAFEQTQWLEDDIKQIRLKNNEDVFKSQGN